MVGEVLPAGEEAGVAKFDFCCCCVGCEVVAALESFELAEDKTLCFNPFIYWLPGAAGRNDETGNIIFASGCIYINGNGNINV